MNICPDCLQCYDDSIENCDTKGHRSLTKSIQGDCLLVDGYKIEKKIESISPVKLYTAAHLESEKQVLIRFIKTNDIISADLKSELERHIEINDARLARVYEFGELGDDYLFVVLEKPEGKSLYEHLAESSSLSEKESIKIARQLAEALAKLHDAGLLHRNVNPGNIFLTNTETSEVKLHNYDFGGIIQNKVVSGINGVNAQPDIFRYFSPEQVAGGEIDFKSDIYSLAVVIYEMLLGRSPYAAATREAIEQYSFNESDLKGLYIDVRALLAYALKESLQKRLHLRPRSTGYLARQFRHLEQIVSPVEVVAVEEPSHKEAPKQMGVRSEDHVLTEKSLAVYTKSDAIKDKKPAYDSINEKNDEPFVANEPNDRNGTVSSAWDSEPDEQKSASSRVTESSAHNSSGKVRSESDVYDELYADILSGESVVFETNKSADSQPAEADVKSDSEEGSAEPAFDQHSSEPPIVIDLSSQTSSEPMRYEDDVSESLYLEDDFDEDVFFESTDPAESEFARDEAESESDEDLIISAVYGSESYINKGFLYAGGIALVALITGVFALNIFGPQNDLSMSQNKSAQSKPKPNVSEKVVKQEDAEETLPETEIAEEDESTLEEPVFEDIETKVPKEKAETILAQSKEKPQENKAPAKSSSKETKKTAAKEPVKKPVSKASQTIRKAKYSAIAEPTIIKIKSAPTRSKPAATKTKRDSDRLNGTTRPRIVSNIEDNR